MKYIYLLLFSFAFVACNTTTKKTEPLEQQNKGIDSILITYFCGNSESSEAIKCERIAKIQAEHPANDYSLFSEGIIEVIDTFIVDKTILEQIKPLLEKKETATNYNEDARMYITVKYTDNTTDNICMGMDISKVMFNEEPTHIESELIYLLRTYSGYYKWFNEEDLFFFKEYQDFN